MKPRQRLLAILAVGAVLLCLAAIVSVTAVERFDVRHEWKWLEDLEGDPPEPRVDLFGPQLIESPNFHCSFTLDGLMPAGVGTEGYSVPGYDGHKWTSWVDDQMLSITVYSDHPDPTNAEESIDPYVASEMPIDGVLISRRDFVYENLPASDLTVMGLGGMVLHYRIVIGHVHWYLLRAALSAEDNTSARDQFFDSFHYAVLRD